MFPPACGLKARGGVRVVSDFPLAFVFFMVKEIHHKRHEVYKGNAVLTAIASRDNII
jgi:hypothetical protein